MWRRSTWESEEDFENDLLLLSEYTVPTDKTSNRVPESIIQYRKQMSANQQKTLNSDIDECAAIVVSGRGRGIKDRVIRPGGILEPHPIDEIDLKKQIRQVSGLGYRNELIEQSIKANAYTPKDIDDSDFKLVATSCSSGSSSRSSSESTPTRKKIHLIDKIENDETSALQ